MVTVNKTQQDFMEGHRPFVPPSLCAAVSGADQNPMIASAANVRAPASRPELNGFVPFSEWSYRTSGRIAKLPRGEPTAGFQVTPAVNSL
jgi:hypothetical protein